MSKPRRKISQREAARLRRRVAQLELMNSMLIPTPYPRWEVCNFTMTDAMMREASACSRFGARMRAERNGNVIRIFSYRPDNDC